MTRRFDEAVHVGAVAGQPVAFRWRGSRYVVRDVLGHWRERSAWWATPAARSVLTGAGPDPLPDPPGRGGSFGVPRPSPRADWGAALTEEFEIWRVEAARGVSETVGVYDLSHLAGLLPAVGDWRLLRVVD